MATYTDVSLDLSTLPVQPSPTNNQQRLYRFDIKESAFNATTFNKTIVGIVESDAIYEILAVAVVAQDGLVNNLTLYAEYDDMISNPGNSGQGIDGFVDVFPIDGFATATIDGELPTTGGSLADFGYTQTSITTISDQYRTWVRCNDESKTFKVYPGANLRCRFNLSAFTPSDEEFLDMAIWLRKTDYNNGNITTSTI